MLDPLLKSWDITTKLDSFNSRLWLHDVPGARFLL